MIVAQSIIGYVLCLGFGAAAGYASVPRGTLRDAKGRFKSRNDVGRGSWDASNGPAPTAKGVFAESPAPEMHDEADAIPEGSESYSVTGARRTPSWSRRRKELEAQHRKKRQQIEEYRESA